jgi:hypothetical protein
LHQGIAGSTVFMNCAVRESVAHFRAAFTHPEFTQALGQYPPSAVASPHLFTRLNRNVRQAAASAGQAWTFE